jgi:hypothetical protein
VSIEQWWRTACSASEIWVAAPQVIALRSARMFAAGLAPRADDRREFSRMVSEKPAAAFESALAVGMQLWRTNLELAATPMRLWWGVWTGAGRWTPLAPRALRRQLAAAAPRLAASGLAPVRRRVTANAKRLRRRKLR